MANIIDKLIERYDNKVVNILGSEYTIKFNSHKDDDQLNDCAAYCSYHENIIVLDRESKNYIGKSDLYIINCIKRGLRHELIHTFLDESGLFCNANAFKGPWPVNEEMVDWFALQMPKIFKVFQELDLLDNE